MTTVETAVGDGRHASDERASRSIVVAPGSAESDPVRAARRRRLAIRVLSIAIPVSLIVLWQLGAEAGRIDVRFFSSPWKIILAWRDLINDGIYFKHLSVSCRRIGLGYLLGAGSGLVLGLMLGRTKILRAAVEPTLIGLYTVPKLAILPLLLLIFGIGETPKILLIAVTVFFIVLINTIGALESVPEAHLDAGRSFGLSRLGTTRHIILPSALPQIFVGLRLASGVAVLALVGAEFVAAQSGLGFLIWNSWNIGIPENMFIGIVSIAILGVLANSLLRLLQRLATPWEQ